MRTNRGDIIGPFRFHEIPVELEPEAYCLRCDRWYAGGEGCPGCDKDAASRYCEPPEWARPSPAESPVPGFDPEIGA